MLDHQLMCSSRVSSNMSTSMNFAVLFAEKIKVMNILISYASAQTNFSYLHICTLSSCLIAPPFPVLRFIATLEIYLKFLEIHMTPLKYNFKNWDVFCAEVVSYHVETYPQNRRVIDIISTMRQFMNPEVIGHLDVLVNLHPRFDTTDGWEDWLNVAVPLLQECDSTIDTSAAGTNTLSPPIGCKRCASGDFRLGNMLLSRWSALDSAVSQGTLSSTEQRQAFWSNAKAEEQTYLLTICEYFDPEHEIWCCNDANERKKVEQLLCYALKLCVSSQLALSKHRQIRFWRRWFATSIFLGLSLLLMTIVTLAASPKTFSWVPLRLGCIMLLLALFTGIRLSDLNREQQEVAQETQASNRLTPFGKREV